MTTSMPPEKGPEDGSTQGPEKGSEDEGQERPDWPLTLLVALACLAVVASGWGVARMTLGESAPGAVSEDEAAETEQPRARASDVDPADAEAFLGLAAQELRAAPAFHISYTQREADREAGRGWARHEPESDTGFEHHFRTSSGIRVQRYEVPGAGYMMSAKKGLPGMTLLDPPADADLRLCSAEFALATMDELASTADQLELVGTEEIKLSESTRGVPASTHTAHRYSGTFNALMGGYEPMSGSNTLTRVAGAEFDLWVDEDGHPRRLSYTSPEGTGETLDYHVLSS